MAEDYSTFTDIAFWLAMLIHFSIAIAISCGANWVAHKKGRCSQRYAIGTFFIASATPSLGFIALIGYLCLPSIKGSAGGEIEPRQAATFAT